TLRRISANCVTEAIQRLARSTESVTSLQTTALPRISQKTCTRRTSKLSRCSALHCQSAEVMRHSAVRQEQAFAKGLFALSFVPKCQMQDSGQVDPPTLAGAASCVGLRL